MTINHANLILSNLISKQKHQTSAIFSGIIWKEGTKKLFLQDKSSDYGILYYRDPAILV